MSSQYLGDLASTWKQVMDEARKQQLIVSYKILGGNPGNREDWDLMLLVESKNWAAFDGLDDKFDGIVEKLVGPEKKQVEMMVKRSDVREILGTRNCRKSSSSDRRVHCAPSRSAAERRLPPGVAL
jgi:hypothetical protein